MAGFIIGSIFSSMILFICSVNIAIKIRKDQTVVAETIFGALSLGFLTFSFMLVLGAR